MLLVAVLEVRGFARQTERLVRTIVGKRDPRRRCEPHHLDFRRPVVVLRRAQRIAPLRDLLEIGLCGARIAHARGADGARLIGDGLGERKLARRGL